ncbi:HPP family protein [Pedobacter aquatilis]|uniref:HPP family protein n=1 Tax=Pedobacter aquatilis TaxID=351343 RepID=UPI00292CA92A|nr:HPP family protein [Pedobacter aquatilis]
MIRKKIKRNYRLGRYFIYKETLVNYKEKFWSFIGAVVGIGIIALIQSFYFPQSDNTFLIGSFGASSVLIYGVIASPLAQPRNLILGHLVSAIVGVTVYKIVPDVIWINAPLAVAFSIIAMQYTKSLHPPGGATALIAVSGSAKIKSLGYLYVLFPVLTGVLILFIVALIFNNLTADRKYPVKSRLKRRFLFINRNKD